MHATRNATTSAVRLGDVIGTSIVPYWSGHMVERSRAGDVLLVSIAIVLGVVSCSSDRNDPIRLIEHENADVRIEAVRALRERPGPDTVIALRRHLRHDPDSRVRVVSVRSFVQVAGELAVPDLASLTGDPSVEVRLAAIEALGAIRGEAAEQPLLSALEDRHARVRRLACRVLADRGVTGADQVERLASRRRDAAVKQAASGAWSRRLEAARELAECADRTALDTLERLTLDPEIQVGAVAARGIGRAASEAGAELLVRVSRSPRTAVRAAMLEGLRESPAEMEPAAVEAVCDLLTSEDTSREAARVVTARSLACDAGSVAPLAGWLEAGSEDREIRAAGTIAILGERVVERSLVERAAVLLWTRARGEDLLTVAGLAEQPVEPAIARVRSVIEEFARVSERWIPLPPPDAGSGDQDEPAAPLGPLGRSTALAAILSAPPRGRAWVELFSPGDIEPSEVAAVVVLAHEVGFELDRMQLMGLTDRDVDPQVRAAAVWALGGGERFLEDQDPLVRASAAEALLPSAGDVTGATKARLSVMLTDDAPGVRRAAAASLAATMDPHAARPLIAAFERWHEPDLARALATLGRREGTAPLEAYLRSTSAPLGSETTVASLEALGRLGGEDQLDTIEWFLDHPEPAVRVAAVRAARSIGGPRAASIVRDREHDFALVVREAVNLLPEDRAW